MGIEHCRRRGSHWFFATGPHLFDECVDCGAPKGAPVFGDTEPWREDVAREKAEARQAREAEWLEEARP